MSDIPHRVGRTAGRWIAVAAVCGLPALGQAAGTIYLSVTPGGLTHYSEDPPTPTSLPYLVIADPPARPPQPRIDSARLNPRASQLSAYARLPDLSIRNLVVAAAQAYGVPQALLFAVMHAESSFNPAARSPVGAIGLMQIMPPTGARYGVHKNLSEPLHNIDVGARYLKDLLQLFDGDMELAVAAYNAGEGAVLKYGGRIPPYKETRDYVPKVMNLYAGYQKNPP